MPVELTLFPAECVNASHSKICLYVGDVGQKSHERIFKLQEPESFEFFGPSDDLIAKYETDAYDCLVGHVAAKDLVMILPSSPAVRYLEYLDPKLPVFVYWS